MTHDFRISLVRDGEYHELQVTSEKINSELQQSCSRKQVMEVLSHFIKILLELQEEKEGFR